MVFFARRTAFLCPHQLQVGNFLGHERLFLGKKALFACTQAFPWASTLIFMPTAKKMPRK